MEGCELVVNFAAESHVDRSIAGQDPFAVTHVIGTGVLLDAARELGVARYLQVSTDEVYGSIESGSFTEDSPLRPVLALLGDEGRRRPAGAGARPHARDRGGHLPRLEQLRPAPVPREADPAVRAERAPRRRAARSTATAARSATGSTSRTSRARSTSSLREGAAGRGLQRGRPGRGGEPRRRRAHPRADGRATSR